MAKKNGHNKKCARKGRHKKKSKHSRTKQRQRAKPDTPSPPVTPSLPESGPLAELRDHLPRVKSPHELAIWADPAHQYDWLPWGLRSRLAAMWTPSRVAALSTSEMVELLAVHGVSVNREAFVKIAWGRARAWGIAEEVWLLQAQSVGHEAPENLFGLCAVELWKRWIPECPSKDVLGSWLAEGYSLRLTNRKAACEKWLQLWDVLRQRMGSHRSLEAAVPLVDGGSNPQHWFVDLACELRVAAATDPELGTRALAFCQDVVHRSFSGQEAWSKSQFREALAEILFHLGRREEGEAIYRGLVDGRRAAARRMWLAEALAYSADAATEEEIARAMVLLEPIPDPGVGIGEEAEALQRLDCLRDYPPLRPMSPVARLCDVGAYTPRILSQRILAEGEAAVPELIALIDQDTDGEEQQWAAVHAIDLLGEMRAAAAVEPMLRYLRRWDAFDEGGRACTEALRQMGAAAVDPLLQAYGDTTDPHRRWALRRALAGLDVQDKRILDLLLGSVDEAPRDAGFGLWLYGDEQAIPLLQRRLEHLEGDEVKPVQLALRELGGETILGEAAGC